MVDYVKLAATSTRLIRSAGRSVTFRQLDRTPADPAKPWLGPADVSSGLTELTAYAVAVDAQGSDLGFKTMVEDLLKRCETVFVTGPQTADLANFDEVSDGGTIFRIKEVQTLKPAETVLLYYVGTER
jgi:hypothetical protein